jgi:hypothetical protein
MHRMLETEIAAKVPDYFATTPEGLALKFDTIRFLPSTETTDEVEVIFVQDNRAVHKVKRKLQEFSLRGIRGLLDVRVEVEAG